MGVEPFASALQTSYDSAQKTWAENAEDQFQAALASLTEAMQQYDSAAHHIKMHTKPKAKAAPKGKAKAKTAPKAKAQA